MASFGIDVETLQTQSRLLLGPQYQTPDHISHSSPFSALFTDPSVRNWIAIANQNQSNDTSREPAKIRIVLFVRLLVFPFNHCTVEPGFRNHSWLPWLRFLNPGSALNLGKSVSQNQIWYKLIYFQWNNQKVFFSKELVGPI